MTGDFTPNYWDLSTDRLLMIKENLLKTGFKLKVIFIQREPFSRLVSQAITNLRVDALKSYRWESRISSNKLGNPSISEIKQKVLELYMLPRERSPYEQIQSKLDTVFESDELFTTFYEEMFEDKIISKISEFLNIPKTLLDTTQVVNASGIDVFFTQDEISLITSRYEDCYEYVYHTNPHIKAKWQASINKYLINNSILKPNKD